MFRTCLFAALSCSPGVALAQVVLEIPTLGYDGFGSPLDGEHQVTLALYDAPNGGSPLWSTTQSLLFSDGHITVPLPGAGDPLTVDDVTAPVWLSFAIDGSAPVGARAKLDVTAAASCLTDGTAIANVPDADGDGYGDPVTIVGAAYAAFAHEYLFTCGQAPPTGYGPPTDCVDWDDTIHPGATEVCNAYDDDCSGVADDGVTDGDGIAYRDNDGDGFGAGASHIGCPTSPGWADNADDCNDNDASIHPDAVELADDGLDSDCDGAANPGETAVPDTGSPDDDPWTDEDCCFEDWSDTGRRRRGPLQGCDTSPAKAPGGLLVLVLGVVGMRRRSGGWPPSKKATSTG